MPEPYPLMLDLADRSCVVVGGGRVAARKVEGLLESGAWVTVISPTLSPALERLHEKDRIQWVSRIYADGMLASYRPVLVFAATDSPAVNRQVASEARQIGAWVNVADGEAAGDFANVAVIRRPPITIGLSTGGASPAVAKRLKTVVEAAFGEEYTILAAWLRDARESLKTGVPDQSMRERIYEQILDSDVLDLLRQGDVTLARRHFDRTVDGSRVVPVGEERE